jgi:hypothetical protein
MSNQGSDDADDGLAARLAVRAIGLLAPHRRALARVPARAPLGLCARLARLSRRAPMRRQQLRGARAHGTPRRAVSRCARAFPRRLRIVSA